MSFPTSLFIKYSFNTNLFNLLDVTQALINIKLVWNSRKAYSHSYSLSYNTNVSEFLRRIVGIPVELQTRLLQYFVDTLSVIIRRSMITPDFDGMGITEIGVDQDVQLKKLYTLSIRLSVGPAKIELYRFQIDRGVSWEWAIEKWSFITGSYGGFYTSENVKYF